MDRLQAQESSQEHQEDVSKRDSILSSVNGEKMKITFPIAKSQGKLAGNRQKLNS